eukprot:TRINITY_DN27032_c0_g1_i4.p1 TRINITY_DN27032_c0_g1~~TRINITY_DN27032_c0_g1_i4.p1  ORF type:complete len:567 (+),score=89.60 TRINITY_DN27032_c0_g1_i4:87-1787(+)
MAMGHVSTHLRGLAQDPGFQCCMEPGLRGSFAVGTDFDVPSFEECRVACKTVSWCSAIEWTEPQEGSGCFLVASWAGNRPAFAVGDIGRLDRRRLCVKEVPTSKPVGRAALGGNDPTVCGRAIPSKPPQSLLLQVTAAAPPLLADVASSGSGALVQPCASAQLHCSDAVRGLAACVEADIAGSLVASGGWLCSSATVSAPTSLDSLSNQSSSFGGGQSSDAGDPLFATLLVAGGVLLLICCCFIASLCVCYRRLQARATPTPMFVRSTPVTYHCYDDTSSDGSSSCSNAWIRQSPDAAPPKVGVRLWPTPPGSPLPNVSPTATDARRSVEKVHFGGPGPHNAPHRQGRAASCPPRPLGSRSPSTSPRPRFNVGDPEFSQHSAAKHANEMRGRAHDRCGSGIGDGSGDDRRRASKRSCRSTSTGSASRDSNASDRSRRPRRRSPSPSGIRGSVGGARPARQPAVPAAAKPPSRPVPTVHPMTPPSAPTVCFAEESTEDPVETLERTVDEIIKKLYDSTPPQKRHSAFLKQCREWHPDKNGGNERRATIAFQRLQAKRSWFLGSDEAV